MRTGQHGKYFWIAAEATANELSIGIHAVIRSSPEVFLNRHIAVTSFDSGSLTLSADERQAGWSLRNGIAMSPKVTTPILSNMPYDQYDEWYVFEEPTQFECEDQFVNYNSFTVMDADLIRQIRGQREPGKNRLQTEQNIEHRVRWTERFWKQIHRVNPESYICEGDNLVFVSRNGTFFTTVEGRLRTLV